MSGIVTTDWPAPCTTSRWDGSTVVDLLEVAAFKCPKFVVLREKIPKSASGNIFNKALREELIGTEVL